MLKSVLRDMSKTPDKKTIRALVHTAVETYALVFQTRHEAEVENPEGIINMKIHNIFIEALGKEIQYYTSLVKSLDSSFGNMLEILAINIATLSFEVKRNVGEPLSITQMRKIAELVRKSHEARKKSKELLEEAKRKVEEMIDSTSSLQVEKGGN